MLLIKNRNDMESNDVNYIDSLDFLKQNPIFKDLNEVVLSSFLECFSLKTWEKHTEFFHGDNTFYKFYIIVSGRLKMYQMNPVNDREFTVFLLTKNDIFDVISLFDGEKHPMNFEALDEVKVLCANRDIVKKWIEEHPKINKALMHYLAHSMRILESNLTDNVLSDIPTRLAKLLLVNLNKSSEELELINDLSHKEIASLLGSTRAVVNRHIQNFKEAGLLEVHRKKTDITNVQLLLDRAGEQY